MLVCLFSSRAISAEYDFCLGSYEDCYQHADLFSSDFGQETIVRLPSKQQRCLVASSFKGTVDLSQIPITIQMKFENQNQGSRMDLTVSATGSVQGKLIFDNFKLKFSDAIKEIRSLELFDSEFENESSGLKFHYLLIEDVDFMKKVRPKVGSGIKVEYLGFYHNKNYGGANQNYYQFSESSVIYYEDDNEVLTLAYGQETGDNSFTLVLCFGENVNAIYIRSTATNPNLKPPIFECRFNGVVTISEGGSMTGIAGKFSGDVYFLTAYQANPFRFPSATNSKFKAVSGLSTADVCVDDDSEEINHCTSNFHLFSGFTEANLAHFEGLSFDVDTYSGNTFDLALLPERCSLYLKSYQGSTNVVATLANNAPKRKYDVCFKDLSIKMDERDFLFSKLRMISVRSVNALSVRDRKKFFADYAILDQSSYNSLTTSDGFTDPELTLFKTLEISGSASGYNPNIEYSPDVLQFPYHINSLFPVRPTIVSDEIIVILQTTTSVNNKYTFQLTFKGFSTSLLVTRKLTLRLTDLEKFSYRQHTFNVNKPSGVSNIDSIFEKGVYVDVEFNKAKKMTTSLTAPTEFLYFNGEVAIKDTNTALFCHSTVEKGVSSCNVFGRDTKPLSEFNDKTLSSLDSDNILIALMESYPTTLDLSKAKAGATVTIMSKEFGHPFEEGKPPSITVKQSNQNKLLNLIVRDSIVYLEGNWNLDTYDGYGNKADRDVEKIDMKVNFLKIGRDYLLHLRNANYFAKSLYYVFVSQDLEKDQDIPLNIDNTGWLINNNDVIGMDKTKEQAILYIDTNIAHTITLRGTNPKRGVTIVDNYMTALKVDSSYPYRGDNIVDGDCLNIITTNSFTFSNKEDFTDVYFLNNVFQGERKSGYDYCFSEFESGRSSCDYYLVNTRNDWNSGYNLGKDEIKVLILGNLQDTISLDGFSLRPLTFNFVRQKEEKTGTSAEVAGEVAISCKKIKHSITLDNVQFTVTDSESSFNILRTSGTGSIAPSGNFKVNIKCLIGDRSKFSSDKYNIEYVASTHVGRVQSVTLNYGTSTETDVFLEEINGYKPAVYISDTTVSSIILKHTDQVKDDPLVIFSTNKPVVINLEGKWEKKTVSNSLIYIDHSSSQSIEFKPALSPSVDYFIINNQGSAVAYTYCFGPCVGVTAKQQEWSKGVISKLETDTITVAVTAQNSGYTTVELDPLPSNVRLYLVPVYCSDEKYIKLQLKAPKDSEKRTVYANGLAVKLDDARYNFARLALSNVSFNSLKDGSIVTDELIIDDLTEVQSGKNLLQKMTYTEVNVFASTLETVNFQDDKFILNANTKAPFEISYSKTSDKKLAIFPLELPQEVTMTSELNAMSGTIKNIIFDVSYAKNNQTKFNFVDDWKCSYVTADSFVFANGIAEIVGLEKCGISGVIGGGTIEEQPFFFTIGGGFIVFLICLVGAGLIIFLLLFLLRGFSSKSGTSSNKQKKSSSSSSSSDKEKSM